LIDTLIRREKNNPLMILVAYFLGHPESTGLYMPNEINFSSYY